MEQPFESWEEISAQWKEIEDQLEKMSKAPAKVCWAHNKQDCAACFQAVSFPQGEETDERKMNQVEEFLILALKELFHIDHFMSDQGNHIFIDTDPTTPKELPWYHREKRIWRFTPEELKTQLLELTNKLPAS